MNDGGLNDQLTGTSSRLGPPWEHGHNMEYLWGQLFMVGQPQTDLDRLEAYIFAPKETTMDSSFYQIKIVVLKY